MKERVTNIEFAIINSSNSNGYLVEQYPIGMDDAGSLSYMLMGYWFFFGEGLARHLL